MFSIESPFQPPKARPKGHPEHSHGPASQPVTPQEPAPAPQPDPLHGLDVQESTWDEWDKWYSGR